MSIRKYCLAVLTALALSGASEALAQNSAAQTNEESPPAANPTEVKPPFEVIFDTVRERAKSMAAQAYGANSEKLPTELANMNYDQYRAIRFNPEHAYLRGQALFEIQPFHPGFIFTHPVKINMVAREGNIRSLPFKSEDFIYEKPAEFLQNMAFERLGFSGFRVHFPMNSGSYKDEVLAFQGASYFRLLSVGQTFGLSARGIAVNTAEANGEEFPHFTEFWLLTPRAGDTGLYIFALLDSPSLTGAYRFLVVPGMPTVMTVDMQLYARSDVGKLGIAPLTSMFMHGENSVRRFDDFRPEVHDSDGLLMATRNDEWIWRALSNPPELRIVGLSDSNPKGFGLLQRDDDFDHYQDIGATYQTRPGLWVEPVGDWGAGRVELVEIPTPSETNDNIVAYWVPATSLKKNQEFSASYILRSIGSDFGPAHLAKVTRTGNSWAALPGSAEKIGRDVRRFYVDFAGSPINGLGKDMPLEAEIQTSSGSVSDVNINRLPDERGWRVSFKLQGEEGEVADMRVYLTLRGNRISEVWNYVWSSKSLK